MDIVDYGLHIFLKKSKKLNSVIFQPLSEDYTLNSKTCKLYSTMSNEPPSIGKSFS